MQTYNYTPNQLFAPISCVKIPRFQRKFSWDVTRAHNLIRDIAEVATKGPDEKHWIGALIYRNLPKPEKCAVGSENGQHSCREIIDGQQRLTTIRLWTLALLHHAEFQGQELNYQLTDIWLQTPNDRQLKAITDGEDVFSRTDSISKVYSYFRFLLWLGENALLEPEEFKALDRRVRGGNIQERWTRFIEQQVAHDSRYVMSTAVNPQSLLDATLNNLSFLAIELAGEEPATVFQALNGNREELGTFDHLRNFVFSQIGVERDSIFTRYWEPAELLFEDVPTSKKRSTEALKSIFLYDYLISIGEGRFGRFNASSAFSSFLRLTRSNRFSGSLEEWVKSDLEREIKTWRLQYSHHFEKIQHRGRELELSSGGKRSIQRIRVVSDGPPAPLVIFLLRCGLEAPESPAHMQPTEIEDILRELEGFMFKTLLSGGSLTNFRSVIIRSMHSLIRRIQSANESSAADVCKEFISDLMRVETSTGVYERDPRYTWRSLRQEIEGHHRRQPATGIYELLKPGPTLALLDVLDEQLGSPRSSGFLKRPFEDSEDPYWVEHIFPQESKPWSRDLKDWRVQEADMKARVHGLGNLTALETGINKTIRNRSFEKKKAILESASIVSTPLNSWIAEQRWTPEEIDNRTRFLVEELERRWPD